MHTGTVSEILLGWYVLQVLRPMRDTTSPNLPQFRRYRRTHDEY